MTIFMSVFWCVFVGLGALDVIQASTLRCYYGSLTNFTETPLSKPLSILGCLDKTKDTTIYVPGFQNKADGPDVYSVVSALLTRGDTNVVLLNWEKESYGLLRNILGYPQVVVAAKLVAIAAGKSIVTLIKNGLAPNRTHCIAHGLGAHLAGWVGTAVQNANYKIASIFGLDPSAITLGGMVGLDSIDASRAENVYGLHTNAGEQGIDKSIGIVDFWANCDCGSVQPGCPAGNILSLKKQSLCSTNRSWKIMSEAIANPRYIPATAAECCSEWKSPTAVINYVGDVDASKTGNFYFSTNAQAPFAKGRSGLRPNPEE